MNETLDTNKEVFRRLVQLVGCEGKIEALDDLVADDVVWAAQEQEPPRGREAAKAYISASRSQFLDLHVTIDEIVAEGDQLFGRCSGSGTYADEVMGTPAAGTKVTFELVHMLRFRDRRIVEQRGLMDTMALLGPLGVSPAATANAAIVRRGYLAFTAGDLDAMATVLADDLVFHVPPGLPISGDHRGRDVFFTDVLGRVVGIIGAPPRVELLDIAASNEHGVGMYTMHVDRDGTAYQWRHINVYRIRDGQIVEIWWTPFDIERARAALA